MIKNNKAMKKDFDFDRVGKRLPYTVPDDFFAKLEDDIYNKVVIQKKRKAETGRQSPLQHIDFPRQNDTYPP